MSDDEFRCPRCGSRLDNEAQLQAHLRAAHDPDDAAHREDEVDEAVRESFPASDVPSSSAVTRAGPPDNDDEE